MPSRRIYSDGYLPVADTAATIIGKDGSDTGITWNMDLPTTANLNVAADGKYYFGINNLSVQFSPIDEHPMSFAQPRFSPEPYEYNNTQSLIGSTLPPHITPLGAGKFTTFTHPVKFSSDAHYPSPYPNAKLAWAIDRAAWLAASANDSIWVTVIGSEGEYWAFNKGNASANSYTNKVDNLGAYVSVLFGNRHPISYYDYVTVPTAPTNLVATNISSEATTFKVKLTWTAPSDNGGLPITAYKVEWSQNNWATTNVKYVTSTSILLELKNSNTFKFRVYAKNDLSSHFGTFGPKVETTLFVTKSMADLDGWVKYGTVSGLTQTLTRKAPVWSTSAEDVDITPLPLTYGMALHLTSTATSTTIPTGTVGIKKTITGLDVGEQYKVTVGSLLNAMYPWNVDGATLDKWKIKVNTTVPTVSSTFTTLQNYPGGDLFEVSFYATSTTHEIKIELSETVVVSTSLSESIVFPAITVEKTVNDAEFKVQDTVFKGSVAEHFDLVTNSVDAKWWVDKENKVHFKRDFGGLVPIATFTDTDLNDETKLHYKDISVSKTTKNLINTIELNNLGATIDAKKTTELEARDVKWIDRDETSVATYGFRSTSLTTNIYQPQANTNRVYNPRFAKSIDGLITLGSASVKPKRVKISSAYHSSNNHTLTSASDVNGSKYAASLVLRASTSSFDVCICPDGSNGDIITEIGGFPVIAVGEFNIQGVTDDPKYYASLEIRAGRGDGGGVATGKIYIEWFDRTGKHLATTNPTTGSPGTQALAEGEWRKLAVSSNPAPTGAYYAAIRLNISGTSLPTNSTYYLTNVELRYDDFEYGGGMYNSFFDGDSTDTTTWLYAWDGEVGASASSVYKNTLDTFTGQLLDKYSILDTDVNNIIWNALEDWTTAKNLDIGQKINIEFQGTTNEYLVIGLEHDITTSSWMMKIHVEKV